ncbi:flavin reductase family protein [Alkalicaulis satelles]|uniref:flavin reductase family protein n=1 Tax=Alkalicaulis satelles TaxID=2609175 RepID=UPI001E4E7E31|nr:flavin reductase family protein [Alkalicaulis satelles]
MSTERAYRDALARFPTGVALVTRTEDGQGRAMTINSFASVSLSPRLVLWSLARDSLRYGAFLAAEHYAINVLAGDQAGLSAACALDDDMDAAGARWTPGAHGAPLVEGAIARFECTRVAVHPGGDHMIILGEVTAFDAPRAAPALVFHQSGYSQAG